jgi:hypothetical protein
MTLGSMRETRGRTEQDQADHACSMKSLGNKARVERVVATLTRLRSVSDVFTVNRELKALVEGDGDAIYKHGDSSSEHSDAFKAIQALRQGLGMASADVRTRWHDAIAKAQVWLSSYN